MLRTLALLLACAGLTSCAVVALPFHVTAEVLKVVPVVGDVAAVPFEAVGNAID